MRCKTCDTDAVGVEYYWITATERCGPCDYYAECWRDLAHNLRTLVVVGS